MRGSVESQSPVSGPTLWVDSSPGKDASVTNPALFAAAGFHPWLKYVGLPVVKVSVHMVA